MVQARPARDPARDVAWDVVRVRVEAGWADHLRQGRAEIVSVRSVEQRLLMPQDSLVTQKAVLNVVRK